MPARLLAVLATLLACASPRSAAARPERPCHRRGPYSVTLVGDRGAALPIFTHRGGSYVLGSLGERYLIRVRNASGRRVEAVVSVDGRDVVDGLPSAWEKRGYLVEPYGEVTIDGYRLSEESVAAFRFSSVPRSYASRMGDARDVGVIGVAVFPERPRPLPCEPLANDSASSGAAPSARGEAGGSPVPSSAPRAAMRKSSGTERPGLGTRFAEEHDSRVFQVPFERASVRPEAVLTLRYDDREGLLALGVHVDRRRDGRDEEEATREKAVPFRRDAFAGPPPGWSGR